MSDLIPVGRIVGTHGLKGFLKLELLTDFPERLAPGERLMLKDAWLEVVDAMVHKDRLLIQLEGVKDRTSAENLRGQVLHAVADRPELEEDEYMLDDLIGAQIVETNGSVVGKLDNVLAMPAQDILVVGEILIPFVRAFVKKVDVKGRVITVELIPGMRPEDPSEDKPEPKAPAKKKTNP